MEQTFAVMVNIYPETLRENYVKGKLIGLDYRAHILHNCLQHGIDTSDLDIQSVFLKSYNCFSVYTMRTCSHGDTERLAYKFLALKPKI
jgi:hypothetical protein